MTAMGITKQARHHGLSGSASLRTRVVYDIVFGPGTRSPTCDLVNQRTLS